ncbi:MAG: NAD-dependent protein deacylase [Bacilli bacterium]|nr:NAD-dependent protein deacylase [Bacilli bacterium]
MLLNSKIKQLKQYINDANNIVFFGGAGVSTESGIPDFRSKNGLYNQHDVNFEKYEPEYLLSSYCLFDEPKVFYEFYRQKLDCRGAKPNITHYKLAELEKTHNITIVTQNVDGLHQMAGSTNVLEIHGSANKVYCRRCGREYSPDYIFDCGEDIPLCHKCINEENPYCPHDKAFIRPKISLYGEFLSPDFKMAEKKIKEADLLIIGGTSLAVYPANSLIYDFDKKNGKIVIINKGKTQADKVANLIIDAPLGTVFENL